MNRGTGVRGSGGTGEWRNGSTREQGYGGTGLRNNGRMGEWGTGKGTFSRSIYSVINTHGLGQTLPLKKLRALTFKFGLRGIIPRLLRLDTTISLKELRSSTYDCQVYVVFTYG